MDDGFVASRAFGTSCFFGTALTRLLASEEVVFCLFSRCCTFVQPVALPRSGVLSGRLGVLDLSWLGLKSFTAGSTVEVKEVEEEEEEEEEEERWEETKGRAQKGMLEMF